MARKRRATQLLLVAVIVFLAAVESGAQEIQNGLSYRDIKAAAYFRFNYENDVFLGTDRYFTQGVHFELVNRGFSKSFIPRLFPSLRNGGTRAGLGLESAGYSPTSILADSILYGDHPFAGLAYAKLFSISIDTLKRRRLTGTLSLGWMGPSAGGYEIQAAIHRAVGSAEPLGWKYQLKDQPVINYELNIEQQIGRTPHWLQLSACGMIRAGTLSNRVEAGVILKVKSVSSRNMALDFYAHPAMYYSVYESVLQGGPFTRNNPYRIDATEMQRIVGRAIGGANLQIGNLSLGIYMRWQTRTFKTGADHVIGGITFATAF